MYVVNFKWIKLVPRFKTSFSTIKILRPIIQGPLVHKTTNNTIIVCVALQYYFCVLNQAYIQQYYIKDDCGCRWDKLKQEHDQGCILE